MYFCTLLFLQVEAERNVVNQSAFAAEKATARRNRCTLRKTDDLTIRQPSSFSIQGL